MKHLKPFSNNNWKTELYSLLEKKIELGDNLNKKLNSMDEPLAKRMLTFFNSDDIKDDANVSKVDYNKDDDKLLTLFDEKGKARKFKFGKLLSYLGYDTKNIKPYEVENFMLQFKKVEPSKDRMKEVSSKNTRMFLDDNHIQGFTNSTYKLGLYSQNELVSLMTFGYRYTNNKKEFELIRFCNKININVIGAASKLFKHFIKNYKLDCNKIISYSEIRLFKSDLYKQLGFEYKHRSDMEFFYHKNLIRYPRQKFQKHKLVKEGYDKSLSAREIMNNKGFYKIYGCGQYRYEFILNN